MNKVLTVESIMFHFDNGKMVSVTVADGEFVNKIEVTFFCRGKGRTYSEHTIPYTADSHKRIMDYVIACGGRLSTW